MENEIKDAEIEVPTGENSAESKKKSFKVELLLFLVLGFLLGIVIKTEAGKRITMGYDDYKVLSSEQGYDLNQVQKDLAEKAKEEAEAAEKNGAPVPSAVPQGGGTCGS